jgi:hypothetical protein
MLKITSIAVLLVVLCGSAHARECLTAKQIHALWGGPIHKVRAHCWVRDADQTSTRTARSGQAGTAREASRSPAGLAENKRLLNKSASQPPAQVDASRSASMPAREEVIRPAPERPRPGVDIEPPGRADLLLHLDRLAFLPRAASFPVTIADRWMPEASGAAQELHARKPLSDRTEVEALPKQGSDYARGYASGEHRALRSEAIIVGAIAACALALAFPLISRRRIRTGRARALTPAHRRWLMRHPTISERRMRLAMVGGVPWSGA